MPLDSDNILFMKHNEPDNAAIGPDPRNDLRISPSMCLHSHRRHSGNFLRPTCSVKGAYDKTKM